MSKRTILPGATIGILGGGQLGRMTAIEAKQMGYRVLCLDPTPDSPCGQVCDGQIVAPLDDLEGALELARQSDVLVYEFENVDKKVVQALEQTYHLPQGSRVLGITQDRVQEKAEIVKAGFPVVPYRVLSRFDELEPALKELGYPAVLKTARGGYDGKGQLVIHSVDDLDAAESIMPQTNAWVLEKFVQLEAEISVIVARSQSGQLSSFPVGENKHRNNVLHTTVVPARIEPSVCNAAKAIAEGIASAFSVVGMLAVEFFVTPEGLMVNELAPRPHNSGHYTFGACYTSQFEQFVRAVCDLPLGPTDLLYPVVMVNILGESIPQLFESIGEISRDIKLHLYGKKGNPQPRRKMGHLLVKTQRPDEVISWVDGVLYQE